MDFRCVLFVVRSSSRLFSYVRLLLEFLARARDWRLRVRAGEPEAEDEPLVLEAPVVEENVVAAGVAEVAGGEEGDGAATGGEAAAGGAEVAGGEEGEGAATGGEAAAGGAEVAGGEEGEGAATGGEEVKDMAEALRRFSPGLGAMGEERVHRAWAAGLRAGRKLRGEVGWFDPTPALPAFPNQCYAVLQAQDLSGAALTLSFKQYRKWVRGRVQNFDPQSVSHGWASTQEAIVYLWASGGSDFEVRD
jgi:hypothetical protein